MLTVTTDKEAEAVDMAMALDVHSLPTETFSRLRYLPKEPAVYFVIFNRRVVYIGGTINLKLRWRDHYERRVLEAGGCVAWLRVDVSMIRPVEKAMIYEFAPPMNRHHTEVGRGIRGRPLGAAYDEFRRLFGQRKRK